MGVVVIGDMPHHELQLLLFLHELLPREGGVLSFVDLVGVSVEYVLHELFFVVY